MLSLIYLLPLYVLFTFLLFLSDIILWPIDTNGVWILSLFVACIICASYLGIYLGLNAKAFISSKNYVSGLKIVRHFSTISAILFTITLMAIFIYTGNSLGNIFELAIDPRLAYQTMLTHEAEKGSGFYLYKILSIIMAPLYYAVIPLMVMRWKYLTRKQVFFGFIFVLGMILFSIFRGTDREIGELVILLVSVTLVLIAQKIRSGEFSTYQVLRVFFILIILFLLFFIIFSFRKYERLSGDLDFCVYNIACANQNSIFHSFMSDEIFFSVSMLTSYLSQGYYGLYLTLGMDQCFTFFVGHSPFLVSAIDNLLNIDLYSCSLMGQLNGVGWSDGYTWSTIYPWLANDISYYLVVPFILLMSLFLATTWKIAVLENLFSAVMVFIFLFYGVIFSTANNQLAIAPEIYTAFIVWVVIFIKDVQWKKTV
ncbi:MULTISPECIES: hypothetical protein [Citrobacter]|nr:MULTISPECIES: hypothetical protein [Citrobacter]MCE9759429.1 hypothetical protein [Citrobacter portucalensis]MDM2904211.1 hypothetical protein [Citrobacter sp. Cpo015]MDM2910159.1 hypothetical protein [Citrobacter sp. Cpo012]